MAGLSFPLSVCPQCGSRAVSRPDMLPDADNNPGLVISCSHCKAAFVMARFFAAGDKVKVLGRGKPGRVESKLTWTSGVMVRFGDGSAGAYLYSDLSREGVCLG